MDKQPSPAPGATAGYSPAAVDWLNSHGGICEEIAEQVGFSAIGDTIRFQYEDAEGAYFRTRNLPDGKTMQPKGRKLSPWTPLGTDGVLLVVEGESDLLSVATALYTIENFADDGEGPEFELVRRADLPPPLANVVPIALPGVGNCHGQVADLAEELGADVLIAFDGDDAGRSNAEKLAKKINGRKHISATIIPLPDSQDISDVLAAVDIDDDPAEALANLIAVAEAAAEDAPVEGDAGGEEAEDGDKRKPTQAELLLALARESGIELWATKEGDPFMTVPVGEHVENHRLSTRAARDWLAHLFYRVHERPPSAQALQDALGVLRGKALYDGGRREAPVRHAAFDGKLYIDLGDADWRAVEIDAEGWRIVADPPVRFRRPRGMLPLPEPEQDRALDVLRDLLNVDDDGWVLIAGWLVGALAPDGPYPVLGLHGERGAAKSSAARLLRDLVDPNVAPLRSEPRDERDLVIAASNGRIVALDNVSSLSANLSDALCRLATGGGFATRELYSDAEEIIFSAVRPAIITGIAEVASRGDLLDRSILVTLEPISEADRLTEAELESRWSEVAPAAFGALLDAASTALRRLPDVSLERLPRMADHALWVTAAEPALSWEHGTYTKVYGEAREAAVETALDASPLTEPVRSLAEGGFEGSATELLEALADRVDDAVTRSRTWPKSARALSSALRRLAPDLRAGGVDITFTRNENRRIVTVQNVGDRDRHLRQTVMNGDVEPDANDANDAADANSGAFLFPDGSGEFASADEEAEIQRIAAKTGSAS